MKWLEIQVKTTEENEDIVTDILYSAGATGLAIEDPHDIEKFSKTEDNWDFIDPNIIDLDFEGILIKAYFSESEDLLETVDFIRDNIEKAPLLLGNKPYGEVIISEIDDKDWAENWKKYYKPKEIGEKIVIKPSWESYQNISNKIVIELDPGMAFGTGTHETTMMCIQSLEKYISNNSKVYDVGCGSGILSIVAAKLGAKKVTAIDLDEVCIKVSNENIKINNVEEIVQVKKGNLLDVIDGKADIIVANIIAEVIVKLTSDLSSYLDKGGIFIASGIIIEKIPLVEMALAENGFKILDINQMNGWACMTASKVKVI
ncbi:50S ribosomal protein L11 methyltransferase [Paratissierella segnis]|jgi:ribosomal protein L11 methyltransferase|uniref:Ribosomal protein L11 methyltransferase n=1 Tax=Paratissierella segnis TaxID=2763679 RepID=A0A926IL75_9FIRM|nr:50S ribosomal protein L11 methyltransferase [Paratissierella segnis]MBC8588388.1 50S ribosomal protein L11 methyltransferase [Paratissierella segnis]